MASSSQGTPGNRNLWIILGVCIGVLLLSSVLSIIWILHKRSRRTSVFKPRILSPLPDDSEIESWRRPSEYTQRSGRYTVMPKRPLPVARIISSRSSLEKEQYLLERPSTPPSFEMPIRDSPPRQSRNFSRPMSSQSSLRTPGRGRTSLQQSRPPTPHSIKVERNENDDTLESSNPVSPRSRSMRSHHHRYPSVSEVSEFDFEFEKSDLQLDLNQRSGRPSQYRR